LLLLYAKTCINFNFAKTKFNFAKTLVDDVVIAVNWRELRRERSSIVFLNVSNVLDAFYLRYGSLVVDDRLIKSNVAYLN